MWYCFSFSPNGLFLKLILGAGISVAAGIPCFTGKDGIYGQRNLPEFPNTKLIDLFSNSALTVSDKV